MVHKYPILKGFGLEMIYPEADVFVRGYGEFAIAELMTNPDKINHTGVHYAGDVDKNGTDNSRFRFVSFSLA